MQDQEEDVWHTVGYWSKLLNETERRYSQRCAMPRNSAVHENASALHGRGEVHGKDGSRGASLDPDYHGIDRGLDAVNVPPFRV